MHRADIPRPARRALAQPAVAALTRGALAIGALATACGGPGDLSEVSGARVALSLAPQPANRLAATLALTWDGATEGACPSLALDATLNGARFSDSGHEQGGWADTSLAGSADHCRYPTWSGTFPTGAAPTVAVRLSDDSDTVVLEVSQGAAPRSLAVTLPGDGTLRPAEDVRIAVTTATGDAVESVSAEASAPWDGPGCTAYRVFAGTATRDAGDGDGWSLSVPDLLADGTPVYDCGGAPALGAGRPLSVTLRTRAVVATEVATCTGAASCAARVLLGDDTPTTLIP